MSLISYIKTCTSSDKDTDLSLIWYDGLNSGCLSVYMFINGENSKETFLLLYHVLDLLRVLLRMSCLQAFPNNDRVFCWTLVGSMYNQKCNLIGDFSNMMKSWYCD